MNYHDFQLNQTRRTFLSRGARGLGLAAFATLLGGKQLFGDEKKFAVEHWKGTINPLHHAPKAKRVIHLYMAGGPSHLETFDFKPKLREMHNQPMPDSFTKGQPIAQLQGQALKCFAPQWDFKKFGKCGLEISELFPLIGSMADDICMIRSMKTEQINHDPAHTFMNTGSSISGRPSMGAWLSYGLGSEAENLPSFVVMTSAGKGGQMQPIAQRMWSSGFLPTKFQGVRIESKGEGVLYLGNTPGCTHDQQHDLVQAVQQLDLGRNDLVNDPEIATRISQYEMAFRMQTSVPELMDVSKETKETLDLYGVKGADGSFAFNCLIARRMAERGVRFIQLYHKDWDHHGNVKNDVKLKAEEVDRPAMALLTDLKRLGMLDDTLVIFGGEFGRTPMSQGGSGRDHHIKGFSVWLAGGGVKGGMSYGNTDELGYNAVEDVCPVHDLHATMLHLLGVNHLRFTYKFQGRDYRLTDVFGEVMKKILV